MNRSTPVSPVLENQNVFVRELDVTGLLLTADQSLDLTLVHQFNPERYPFLLESVAKSKPIPGSEANLGQFDILFAFPQQTLQLNSLDEAESFVEQVQQTFQQNIQQQEIETELPFSGGWFAYFSYDYAQVVEPVLELPKPEFPLANLTRIPAAIVVDHQTSKLYLVAEAEFVDLLEQMEADIRQALESMPVAAAEKVHVLQTREEPEQKYLDGVEAIKEYILAGDVFQVNLSRQWQVELEPDTDYLQVYRALRKSNPAPFAALTHFAKADRHGEDWQIISSSPERLVKYKKPWVETRPIAGTRKRGENEVADQALVEELIAHPKERAEHIMLIDLERNDLGRICQPGTVEVNDLMVVETYEHVHHIVSNVRGKLRDGFTPLDIVHALFPGGTITGCPKVRCMQIVAELEQMPREAYTGSLGYINLDGSMDLNILIRTMIQYQQDGKPMVQFRAGAGIVADSKAANELTETRHKAKGLIRAFAGEDTA